MNATVLARLPFLKGAPPTAIAAVKRALRPMSVAAGTVLFRTGEDGDACYLVEAGTLQVTTAVDGRDLATIGPGSFVGELALLLDAPRSATVTAITDAHLYELRRTDLDELLEKHPALSIGISRELGQRIVASNRLIAGHIGPRRTVVWPGAAALDVAQAVAARSHRVAIGALSGARVSAARDVRRVTAPRFGADEPTLTAVVLAAPDEPAPRALKPIAEADHVFAFGEPPQWLLDAAPPNRLVRLRDDTLGMRRAVRWATGRAVGIALSSGGSKTVAHIGVLRALDGVEIDAVAGSSGGSIAAVGFAFGQEEVTVGRRWVADIARATHWRRLDLNIPPRSGLSKGRRLRNVFAKWDIPRNLEDADIPVWLVASDVATGRAVTMHHGSVADAMRASMSVPGAFDPWRFDGHLLIDGAVVNPLPTDVLRDAGVGVVLASNVAGQNVQIDVEESTPRLMQIMGRMLNAAEREVISKLMPMADVVIRPVLTTGSTFDFSNFDAAVAAGEEAARKRLPEIRKLLRAASDLKLPGVDR